MTTVARPMLHCILREPPRSAALPAGLRWLGVDGLGAVVGDVDTDEIRAADSSSLTVYADLIARIHGDETLIPMRFGCVFPTDEAVCKLLDGHRGRLLAMLDHLDDCVEFGVRLVLPAPSAVAPPPSPDGQAGTSPAPDPQQAQDPRPGHGHLAAIRQRLNGEALAAARARQARGALEQAVAGLFRDLHEEFGQIGGHDLLSLYFLVPRAAAADFVAGLRQDQPAIPGTGLITGPWPPYNFVGAIDDDLRSLA